ncbi:MAG: molybdopterin molybdotransferase MoeA [Syntrophobacteraceae bacterium]|nr:molybdopterin molybdotransferase MoeA [Syntrophobacteraceae bacterium]
MDLNEAKTLAAGLAERLAPETVNISSAPGRVLAESVCADRDMPSNPISKWDGFAIISKDCLTARPGAPVILPVAAQDAVAGHMPAKAAGRTCVRIMTGSVLPSGTDVVVAFEDATLGEKGLVVTKPLRPGDGVIQQACQATRGDILLRDGDVLTPTRLSLAAAAGRQSVRLVRRPRVAILATGDELRESGRGDRSISFFCNNSHLFASLVLGAGGLPVELGVAPDDPGVIYSRLEKVEADLVITTGGMGKGSKDFIAKVWERLGLAIRFDRLNLVPGKSSGLATGNGTIFLGLPGNPLAARIVYEEIGAPMIRSFLGLNIESDFALQARATRPMQKREGLYRALDGVLEIRDSLCAFAPNRPESGSRPFSSLRNTLAYALLPPGDRPVAEGEMVQVKIPDLPLPGWAVFFAGNSSKKHAL